MTGDNQPSHSTVRLTDRLDINFALKAAKLGIWEMDPVTKLVNWDDRCQELFGFSRSNSIPYEVALNYIHPDDQPLVVESIRLSMNPASGGAYDVTHRTIGADDGLLRWVRFIGQSYFTDDGVLYRFAGIAQDVTNDVKAKQLQASEEQFRMLVEQAPVGIAVIRGDEFIFETVNQAYLPLIGRTRAAVLGKPLFSVLPETRSLLEPLAREIMRTGISFPAREFEITINRNGQDERCYFNSIWEPLRTAEGGADGFIIVAHEVTEQVLARRRVEESEAKFRSLIEEASIGSCLFVGRDLRIEVANDIMLGYWGKDSSVLGRPLHVGVPELIGQPFLDILDRVYTSGETYVAHSTPAQLFTNGALSTYYFDFTYKPLRDTAGNVYAIMDTAVDVTAQVVAQQQLGESERRFRNIVEQAPVAILIVKGEELRIDSANPEMLSLMDRSPDCIGQPLELIMPELSGQAILTACKEVFRTQVPYYGWGVEVQIYRKGKLASAYFNVSYTPYYDGLDIVGVMQVVTEVTDQVIAHQLLQASEERYRHLSAELDILVQRRTEELASTNEELAASNDELTTKNEEYALINEELTESTKLLVRSNENLQRFAYVASHDLQEPLRKIQQFGDLLKERYAPSLGDGADYLNRMQLAASRMSTLIRDLLSFSRIATQRDTSDAIALETVIEGILGDLELLIQETGAIVTIHPLPVLQGDVSQLGLLFQNLLNNALKFHRPGVPPEVTVRASLIQAADLPTSVRPARLAPAYHLIEVVDNGIGFDEKYLDRIFQVFQRLHGVGEFTGTGVGLAICEKVATNHGGAITASSYPGQGSTFCVYLPT